MSRLKRTLAVFGLFAFLVPQVTFANEAVIAEMRESLARIVVALVQNNLLTVELLNTIIDTYNARMGIAGLERVPTGGGAVITDVEEVQTKTVPFLQVRTGTPSIRHDALGRGKHVRVFTFTPFVNDERGGEYTVEMEYTGYSNTDNGYVVEKVSQRNIKNHQSVSIFNPVEGEYEVTFTVSGHPEIQKTYTYTGGLLE